MIALELLCVCCCWLIVACVACALFVLCCGCCCVCVVLFVVYCLLMVASCWLRVGVLNVCVYVRGCFMSVCVLVCCLLCVVCWCVLCVCCGLFRVVRCALRVDLLRVAYCLMRCHGLVFAASLLLRVAC